MRYVASQPAFLLLEIAIMTEAPRRGARNTPQLLLLHAFTRTANKTPVLGPGGILILWIKILVEQRLPRSNGVFFIARTFSLSQGLELLPCFQLAAMCSFVKRFFQGLQA
jgi:hypothetical protein